MYNSQTGPVRKLGHLYKLMGFICDMFTAQVSRVRVQWCFMLCMGGSRGGGEQGSGPNMKNHKWLQDSLEVLVRTPTPEKQLDPLVI